MNRGKTKNKKAVRCPCRILWRAVLLLRQVYPAQSVRTNRREI